jgi:hypothetical protein
MEAKSNKFLIGLICIILGAYFLVNQYFGFKLGDTVLFVWSGAFLLLYHTKRKVWSLVIGSMTLAIWGFRNFPNLGANVIVAAIFIIPGIIFMTLYFSRRKSAFLITGSMLAWLGVFSVLAGIPKFEGLAGSIFFICMGMAFLTIYMVNHREIGKWPIFPAVISIVFGFMVYSGKSPVKLFFGVVPSIIPIILIIMGVVLVIKSVIKR